MSVARENLASIRFYFGATGASLTLETTGLVLRKTCVASDYGFLQRRKISTGTKSEASGKRGNFSPRNCTCIRFRLLLRTGGDVSCMYFFLLLGQFCYISSSEGNSAKWTRQFAII